MKVHLCLRILSHRCHQFSRVYCQEKKLINTDSGYITSHIDHQFSLLFLNGKTASVYILSVSKNGPERMWL